MLNALGSPSISADTASRGRNFFRQNFAEITARLGEPDPAAEEARKAAEEGSLRVLSGSFFLADA